MSRQNQLTRHGEPDKAPDKTKQKGPQADTARHNPAEKNSREGTAKPRKTGHMARQDLAPGRKPTDLPRQNHTNQPTQHGETGPTCRHNMSATQQHATIYLPHSQRAASVWRSTLWTGYPELSEEGEIEASECLPKQRLRNRERCSNSSHITARDKGKQGPLGVQAGKSSAGSWSLSTGSAPACFAGPRPRAAALEIHLKCTW